MHSNMWHTFMLQDARTLEELGRYFKCLSQVWHVTIMYLASYLFNAPMIFDCFTQWQMCTEASEEGSFAPSTLLMI